MATRTITKVYSDVSGAEIEDGNGGTVRLALDGVQYEVDLTSDEQAELREALAKYLSAGRTVSNRGTVSASRSAPSGFASPKEIRAWAQENGYEVPQRGRIPAPVLEAFKLAH